MSHSFRGPTFVVRAAVLSVAALALGACEGKSCNALAVEGAAGKSGDASTTDVAAGNSGDASTTANVGALIVIANGGPSGTVSADVELNEPGVGPQDTCDGPMTAGACQLTSCRVGGIGSPGGGYGNFGPISVTVGTTTEPLTYDRDGYPTIGFPASIALGTGGIMKFRGGNGSNVPTFDVSATIPGLGVITSPVPTTDGGSAMIDTTQDLSVTWSPISIGQIHFMLFGGNTMVGEVEGSISCIFAGTSGAGVVSRSLLSALKSISGANTTYADLSSELDVTTVVDGLTIVTQSYQSSPSTDHGFDVTLQ